MNVTAVESATITAIGYDEGLGLLRLEFRSGAVYDYFGVPGAVHDALLRAPSIVRGCFRFCRVLRIDSERRREGEL
jgi:hypothetical protein